MFAKTIYPIVVTNSWQITLSCEKLFGKCELQGNKLIGRKSIAFAIWKNVSRIRMCPLPRGYM